MVNISTLHQLNKFLGISELHMMGITGKNSIIYIDSNIDSKSFKILSETIYQISPDVKIELSLEKKCIDRNMIVHVGYDIDIKYFSDKFITFRLDESLKSKYFITSLNGKYTGWLCEIGNRLGLYVLMYEKLKQNRSSFSVYQNSTLAYLDYLDTINNLI